MRSLLLLFSLILFTSCQVEEIISLEDDYVEYTVVQSQLIPDQHFPGVRFTRTLPLGVTFNINDAELKNIICYIKINGIQVVPLHYVSEGMYKSIYEFYVRSGETYELFAQRDQTYIYAFTRIPNVPEISNTHYNNNEFYLNADVANEPGIVYAALWVITTNQQRAKDFFTVSSPQSTPGISIQVRTSSLPQEYRLAQYNGYRAIQVYAFDKSFREYFNSRTSGENINDPYIQGGGPVEWNVQGDKVIGMFVGVSPGNITIVN